jgi:hypothetical protein
VPDHARPPERTLDDVPVSVIEPAPLAGVRAVGPERVLALQRTIGNRATTELLKRRLLRSPLSDELTGVAKKPNAAVFDLLRRRGPADADADAHKVIEERFAAGSADRTLAENLLRHGPEPAWPTEALRDRGNFDVELPYPEEAKDTARIPPVKAFFFPGTSELRALIIGGVHGSEPQGAEVVESLRVELERRSKAGKQPFFTIVLVPVLIERTHRSKLPKPARRYVPRSSKDDLAAVKETGIEPNRTFPKPGEDYEDARKRAATGSELEFDPPGGKSRPPKGKHASQTILPENRVLIRLTEQFAPDRIASVHAHYLDPGKFDEKTDEKTGKKTRTQLRAPGSGRPGNDPGIFVDPRRPDPGDKLADDPKLSGWERLVRAGKRWFATDDVKQDDRLAEAMLRDAQRRVPKDLQAGERNPFMGNVGGTTRFPETVHYDPSAGDTEGYSLGDWAPTATDSRRGITTVTVEIPQYDSSAQGQADTTTVQEATRDMLLEVFLGDPATVTPRAPAPAVTPAHP